jgi:hypothetical protein
MEGMVGSEGTKGASGVAVEKVGGGMEGLDSGG